MAISAEDRAKLVQLARQTVRAEVAGLYPSPTGTLTGALAERRGCFVTLTNKGRLRGCIGNFTPDRPLGELVVRMASAAARDPRFVTDPIRPEEVKDLTVEVSVLSPLQETAEPEKLQVGTHGIYVTCGGRAGCFLPEVATDQGWDAEEFLACCCAHKAALPPDAWRRKDAKVYLFTSEKFDH